MTKLPLVVIEWDDHNTGDAPVDATTVDSYHKPEVITTIGWVLKEDATGYTLVNEYYDDTYRGRTFIDKRMVRKVTPYRLTRPHTKRIATDKSEPRDHNIPS